MKRLVLAVSVCVLLLSVAALAGPPQGWPEWLTVVLAAALPWLFQVLLGKLPGWVKLPLSWVLSFGIAVGVGFGVLGIRSLGDILKHLPWLWAGMQFVYSLMVKPAARSAFAKGRTGGIGAGIKSSRARLERLAAKNR